MGDLLWPGTAENFILNWQEKFQLYETLVDSSDQFSGVQKCTILDNVVDPIISFQEVKTSISNLKQILFLH